MTTNHQPRRRLRSLAVALGAVVACASLAAPAGAAPVGTKWPATNAFMKPFTTSTVVTALDAPNHCTRVRVPGYTMIACGKANTAIGVVIWSVQKKDGIRRMYVFEQVGADKWKPKLRAIESFADDWTVAKAVAGDPDNDGKQELVMGIRHAGTGGILELDVVDIRSAHAKVTGHVELYKGGARVEKGSIRTSEAYYDPGVPSCCPTKIDWNRGQWSATASAWRVVARAIRSASAAVLWTTQF